MKKAFILTMSFCSVLAQAQAKLKKADKFFAEMAYVDAAKAYDDYLSSEQRPGLQTLRNAGDAHYLTGDFRGALNWFDKLYGIQGQEMDDAHFMRYIQSLKGVTDYARADQLTKEYLTRKGDQAAIARYAAQKSTLDSLSKAKPLYVVSDLEANSAKSDFGASFYGEKLIFASARDTSGVNVRLYSWNKQPFLNLYIADRNSNDGSLFNILPFMPNILEKYHESNAVFAPDMQTVYYTTNVVGTNNKLRLDGSRTNNFQIIRGKLKDGRFTNPERLFFDSDNYSVGHPAVSDDGRWLFFASDMPGGFGGSDLYAAPIAADGTVGTPQNLGPTINTAGEEMFPFISKDVLYFASDGHYGLGGLDIYKSSFSAPFHFSAPKNLGAPINSNRDDFGYIVDDEDAHGYISSNRAGGKGDDDLYYFTKARAACNQAISGKVTDAKSSQPVEDATVKVFDSFGDLVAEATTVADGSYKITAPCNKKLKLLANKTGYSTDSKDAETKNVNDAEIHDVNFQLTKYEDLVKKERGEEKIIVNPIYFDYDKWDITPQAAKELDRVVFVMQNFPNVKIKIESHTDSRGKDAYNLKLSDNRAKSTQRYIISKGIDPARIESATGYGESRLVNRCANGVKCTEAEHLMNRRSDFIVTGK